MLLRKMILSEKELVLNDLDNKIEEYKDQIEYF